MLLHNVYINVAIANNLPYRYTLYDLQEPRYKNFYRVLVAKRKACLQPEKTQGYQYLFAVQFFNSYVYRGRLVAGLDKVFENRDRHHRIRRQILRQNEGLIWFLAQS